MSHGQKSRTSVAPEARLGTLRSVRPGTTSESASPVAPGSVPRPLDKPAKNALQCIRHDARSAFHSLSGFIELLGRGTLGPVSNEQRLAMSHIRSSARRLMELVESSVELGQPHDPLPGSELRLVSVEGLLLTILNTSLREQPGLRLELQSASACHGLLSYVEPEELLRALRILIAQLAGPSQRELQLRLSETELHVVLVISTLREEGSVTQSMPIPYPAISTVDTIADLLESRDYVQLKRCESMLTRQQGTLLVAGDLSRVRLTLPKHLG